MKRRAGNGARHAFIAGCLCLIAGNALAQENKTVLGATNPALQDGANALKAGDAQEGVRLTLLGLQQASSSRERQTAKSNLCAGYALLEQYAEALSYCDEVLAVNDKYWRAHSNRALVYIKLQRFPEAEQDLLKGEAIKPNSRTLQAVRKMYLDATNPVSPNIIIDDRRRRTDDTDEE